MLNFDLKHLYTFFVFRKYSVQFINDCVGSVKRLAKKIHKDPSK